MHNLQNAAAE
jgi:hypothetical protein